MYGSLLDDWNMLAIDLRGTGRSTDLDCPSLQNYSGPAAGATFTAAVGTCAQSLDHRWKTPSGHYIEASDLFTSVSAAADVAAVVRSLDIGRIDLYGDSYGSFFAQVFANHYPSLIRSLILDSTYATQALDPWYRSTIDSMPSDFDNACRRSPACAQSTTGPAWNDIEALAARLRQSPITGVVPGPSGTLDNVTMNVVGLVDLVNDAAGDPLIYRGLDASARALLVNDDPTPLLRLYAQRLAVDETYFHLPATEYSGELYFAVSCLDYPQLFDMSTNEATRLMQLSVAEQALPPSTFAPFTTAEWLAQNENTEAYTACVAWPSPTTTAAPTTGQPLLPPAMPVLVLGGEFDTWTPPSGVTQVTAELGGHSRFIELANATHVVGEGDQPCASQLMQTFVRHPGSIDSMDASCATAVAPIDSVGVYADALAQVPPLTAAASSSRSPQLLEMAVAAVDTAGDALSRSLVITGDVDHGLHGGTAVDRDGGRILTLTDDQLVPGTAVSGQLHVTATAVSGRLTATFARRRTASFTISWPLDVSDGQAQVHGVSRGHVIVGTTDAP
jgi:pimeloyl-ACP methyl ester carboxylesterase